MSDQTDSQVANEDANASQAEISQKQSGETQSGNSLAGAALAELALKDPEAAEQLRRHYQSEKDKGVEQAKKTAQSALDEVQKIANRLNISPEQVEKVRKDMLLEELYQERFGNSQAQVGGQRAAEAQPQASSVDIAKIKQAYNDIDFNDPVVLQAVAQNINNEEGLLAALGKVKVSRVSKPQPTAASAVSPAGSVNKARSTVEELQAEYDKLSTSEHWKSGKARRAEIIEQLKELDKA